MKELIKNIPVSTKSAFVIYVAIFIVTAIISNYFDWANDIFLIVVALGILFTIIGIVYAWIINPIREQKKIEAEKLNAKANEEQKP